MKLKNLLFIGTLLFFGNSVSATVVDGVRQKPIPQKSAMQYGTAMYLYNIGSKQFFKGANDYSTRGSVGDAGYKVWITKHLDASQTWDNQSVIIKDSVETAKKILMTWAAGNGDLWVDWNKQADTLWTILPQADEVYRFSVGAGNPVYNTATYPNLFLGTISAQLAKNTRLYWNLAPDTSYVDWYFVSVADAKVQAQAMDVYTTAQQLKVFIDDAKAKSVDVSTQEAVYLDETSTKDALLAAITGVKDALAKYEEGLASASAPLDKTTLIVNSSYDTNANTGWSGTAPALSYNVAEFYAKTYDYSQVIGNAPRGVYAVSLNAFYRAGNSGPSYDNYKNNTNYNAKLYAYAGIDSLTSNILNPFSDALTTAKGMNESTVTDAVTGISYYVPNNMQTADAYFKDGLYAGNKLFFATEDGTMRIGMKKSTTISGDWTLFDNWKLTYYGNGADAYAMWLGEVKKSAKDYSTLPVGTISTVGVIDAYNAKVAGLTTASTKQEVLDAIAMLQTEGALVDSNLVAWKSYQEALLRGKIVANDSKIVGTDKDLLADYCDLESEDILNAATLTTAEVNAETAKVDKMINDAIRNGITEGTDVSDKYLVNANFENTTGWTINKADGGAVAYGGTATNKCFEAWNNSNFDIYQEVKQAPVGVYELSLQGFYRYGRGNDAYNAYMAGTANNTVVNIYVNNNITHFKSVFDEHVAYTGNGTGELYAPVGTNDLTAYINPDSTYWYPNEMANSAIAFANGLYKISTFGVVSRQGDVLRVGVKGATNQLGDSWAIWDNFKMVFQGTNATAVKPLLQQQIDNVTALAATTDPMGKSVLDSVNLVLATANAAIAQTDGKVMFTSLTALLDATDSIKTSVALFKQLSTKRDELSSAIVASPALQATKDQAALLLETIENGLTGKTLENAQATALIGQVDVMETKLAIPADAANASDATPVDMTSLIKTPNFDKDGANSVEGWNANGYSYGNDDTQKGALMIEFYNKAFDLNQTIVGLPNGTYKLSARAFYRFGSVEEDYEKFNADNKVVGNAFLYAVDTDSVKCPVNLLASGATADLGYTGTSNISGTTLYVPNDMVSSNAYFSDGGYSNNVIVKVTDGKLTIGMKKDINVASDWVITDSWKLTYYGENSAQSQMGFGTGIDGVQDNVSGENAVTKIEFFSINGAKKNSLTKGINIVKQTLNNGTVKVSKVLVK